MATQKSFTKKQIDDAINSQLADNTSQAITASNVRSITKNYMSASTYAPVMIYAGILKHNEGSGSAARSIKELYYNPDFFAKQLANDPTNAYNIYKLSSIAVTANNSTYVVAPAGGDGEDLRLLIVVSSNQITSMTVIEPGFGYKVGDVLNFSVGGTSRTITYQGAVRAGTGQATFDLTQNTDNIYLNHTENNTVVVGTPVYYDQSGSEGLVRDARMSSMNVLASRIDLGTEYEQNLQHIQLYRVAENS